MRTGFELSWARFRRILIHVDAELAGADRNNNIGSCFVNNLGKQF
jgi:hypothetical protein